MSLHKNLIFLFFLPFIFSSTKSIQHCTNTSATHVKAAFWLHNSNHYSPITQINTSLYTHLYYSSLKLDSSNFRVLLPPSGDELSLFSSFSTQLKSRDPYLKTLFSISSIDIHSDNSSAVFSDMVANSENRASFIESAMGVARNYSFDGINLSWEFPSSMSDMDNFGLLVEEWRARIEEEAKMISPKLLLTGSVYFSGHIFDAPSDNLDYPIERLSRCLDWVNTLSFAYHSDGDVTAADSALYDVTSHLSTSYGITSWLDAGLPPCKIVMGFPLYGRSWFLKNKLKHDIGAEIVADGSKQRKSNQTGILAYFEIEKTLKDPDAEFTFNNRTVSAYFHLNNQWVSFDSSEVVEAKIEYARRKDLLGYFLWPISFDTSNNTISQLASDVWARDRVSEGSGNGIGTAQSLSPVELPPQGQDHVSGSRESSLQIRILWFLSQLLVWVLAVFLIFLS